MDFDANFKEFWNRILRENFKKSLKIAVKILVLKKNPVTLWVAPEGHTFYNIHHIIRKRYDDYFIISVLNKQNKLK